MNFKIYKITNKINGMVYVGQTMTSLKKRFNVHKKRNRAKLRAAMDEYGHESFEIEALEETPCPIVAMVLEVKYINKFDSVTRGYNTRNSVSPYSRHRGKHAAHGPSPFRGKTHSPEARKKMRDAKKDVIPWNKGKKGIYSAATLEKMSQLKLGNRHRANSAKDKSL